MNGRGDRRWLPVVACVVAAPLSWSFSAATATKTWTAPMRSANSMLLDATRKLLELHDDPEWATASTGCPPVLWFGNATSSKPKVLTSAQSGGREIPTLCRNPVWTSTYAGATPGW